MTVIFHIFGGVRPGLKQCKDLHFPTCGIYRKNLLQQRGLGEASWHSVELACLNLPSMIRHSHVPAARII